VRLFYARHSNAGLLISKLLYFQVMNDLKEITKHFAISGKIAEILPLGSGHIHDTYHVITASDQTDDYVLQRINTNVFRDPDAVMHNLKLVTSHIEKKLTAAGVADLKRQLNKPVWLKNGQLMYRDPSDQVWRCFIYIPDQFSFDRAINNDQVYEGGKAFGKFLAFLSDIPVNRVQITIKDFHNLDWRIHQFQDALQNGIRERIKETNKEIKLLLDRTEEMRTILILGKEGKIPLRVVHHDTKINNVLYSKEGKALCVIDLDTVMPGYVHDDFGDAIRTFTNTGEEDDPDLEKVSMNISYFKSFAEGFLENAGKMLNQTEKDYLALSARMITYMQSLRFLADYINGDIYYRIHHPLHNLHRTKAQVKLMLSMEEQYEEMKRIIKTL
jgi:Ser/Thr protein kinase RdoA (MazF antagonist)